MSNPVIHLKSCSFYADEPEELVNLQEKEWQPILQWFNNKYGILHFIVMLTLQACMYMYVPVSLITCDSQLHTFHPKLGLKSLKSDYTEY